MRRSRHVIAVMVVATAALCADRAHGAVVAPMQPARSQTQTRSFVTRIASSFRQSVAPVRMVAIVRSGEKVQSYPLPIRDAASGVRSEFSPFQFRLPPPSN